MILTDISKFNINALTLRQCQNLYTEQGFYVLCSGGKLIELLLEKDN